MFVSCCYSVVVFLFGFGGIMIFSIVYRLLVCFLFIRFLFLMCNCCLVWLSGGIVSKMFFFSVGMVILVFSVVFCGLIGIIIFRFWLIILNSGCGVIWIISYKLLFGLLFLFGVFWFFRWMCWLLLMFVGIFIFSVFGIFCLIMLKVL